MKLTISLFLFLSIQTFHLKITAKNLSARQKKASLKDKSQGTFDVSKWINGGKWLEGTYSTERGMVARSFYGYNETTKQHVMYFMDIFGGHGKATIKKREKNKLEYKGELENSRGNFKFTRTLTKISFQKFSINYVVNYPQVKEESTTVGECFRLYL